MISRPVFESGMEDLKLERHEPIKEVLLGGGRLDGVEDDEEIGAFCRSLVEETEAGEACQTKIPELSERERGYDEGVESGCLVSVLVTYAQYQGQIVRFARDDSVAGHLRQRPPALRHLHVQQRSSHRSDISLLEKKTHNQRVEIALLPVPSEVSHRTPLGREYVFREEGSQRISLAYARVIHQRLGQPPRQMK